MGISILHGSHTNWKTWKNKTAFCSQGKVSEFLLDWKSQGILHRMLKNNDFSMKLGEKDSES